MTTLQQALTSLEAATKPFLSHAGEDRTEPPLPPAGEGRGDVRSTATLIHSGERVADAMSRELEPITSVSRVVIAPMWLEPWAACLPLRSSGLARVLRTATILRSRTGLVCIDPCLPEAWARTPLGERMRSLHPRETADTYPHTLRGAVGPCAPYTEVIFTSLAFQSLREIVGTTHDDGVEGVLAPLFPGARIYVGTLERTRADDERPSLVRGGLDRVRRDAITVVDRPTLLPSGLVAIPTPGPVPEHLTVAFPMLCSGSTERTRVAIVSSSFTTRDALSPYESALPGLREHARLRDADIAPRGDAHDPLSHRAFLRFERALADRDPRDPRFHLAHPSQELRP